MRNEAKNELLMQKVHKKFQTIQLHSNTNRKMYTKRNERNRMHKMQHNKKPQQCVFLNSKFSLYKMTYDNE